MTMMRMREEEKSMADELSYPILLSERVRKTVEEAESLKLECAEVGRCAESLAHMLRTLVCLAAASSSAASKPPPHHPSSSSSSASSQSISFTSSSIYDRPIRRIVAEAAKNLERALTLVRKCKHRTNLLHRVFTITTAADFRKLLSLLEASHADMRWLLSILKSEEGSGGIVPSLPPIASIDPILAWVWSYVAVLHTPSSSLSDRIDSAKSLASLALDSDRNKKIIIEEGGVPPLLKLLADPASSPDAQIAAATALTHLATDPERVFQIASYASAIPLIVQVLGESPAKVQIRVAQLLAEMAAQDPYAREEFGVHKSIHTNRRNPLVT